MFGKHGRKITGKQPCTWQDLAAARRQRAVALRGLETAQSRLERAEALAAYLQEQLLELKDSSSERANEIKQDLREAEQKLNEAETKLETAQQKYEEAQAKVQAGRGQAGGLLRFCVCSCCLWFAALPHGHRLLFGALLLAKISSLSFTVLACSTSGSGRGFRIRGLLAALGSCKSGCPSCFADASERGVSPRLEVGGSACFALALRSPGCGCFCLRLDFQVTVSVRGSQGTWVLSAFSTRTLPSGSRQDECRPGGFCVGILPGTPACPRLLVVVRFRAVHRCCFLGCCFPLSPSSLRCLHCVGLQHFGEREGAFGAEGSLAAVGSIKLDALLVVPMLQNGVSVRGSRCGGQPVLCLLCALQVAVVFV